MKNMFKQIAITAETLFCQYPNDANAKKTRIARRCNCKKCFYSAAFLPRDIVSGLTVSNFVQACGNFYAHFSILTTLTTAVTVTDIFLYSTFSDI
jgi:hypothetical protein